MTRLIRLRGVLMTVLIVFGGTTLSAHDFWIEPPAFQTRPGALVGLHLMVGERMLGDAIPRDTAGIERFVVARDAQEQPVPGREGGDPAGVLRVDGAGLLIVGYHSRPHAIELTADKFEKYLGEEGLDAVQAILARMKRKPAVAREQFSRCAKSLLSSGATSVAERDRAIGLPLELVADRNPYALAGTQPDFPVTLLYRGKPLRDALVIAINRDDPDGRLRARTDRDGRVSFRLPRSGVWLIKAVHMIPAESGHDVDWESFWASLTFELRAAGAPAAGS
ncbi:MAG TPA: DUF4198 domain-containing protein [Vicinamibacterales bacterium]|nr:DUF4198 domain-containing protein [Vicinamibacterales bacterium]